MFFIKVKVIRLHAIVVYKGDSTPLWYYMKMYIEVISRHCRYISMYIEVTSRHCGFISM